MFAISKTTARNLEETHRKRTQDAPPTSHLHTVNTFPFYGALDNNTAVKRDSELDVVIHMLPLFPFRVKDSIWDGVTRPSLNHVWRQPTLGLRYLQYRPAVSKHRYGQCEKFGFTRVTGQLFASLRKSNRLSDYHVWPLAYKWTPNTRLLPDHLVVSQHNGFHVFRPSYFFAQNGVQVNDKISSSSTHGGQKSQIQTQKVNRKINVHWYLRWSEEVAVAWRRPPHVLGYSQNLREYFYLLPDFVYFEYLE